MKLRVLYGVLGLVVGFSIGQFAFYKLHDVENTKKVAKELALKSTYYGCTKALVPLCDYPACLVKIQKVCHSIVEEYEKDLGQIL